MVEVSGSPLADRLVEASTEAVHGLGCNCGNPVRHRETQAASVAAVLRELADVIEQQTLPMSVSKIRALAASAETWVED